MAQPLRFLALTQPATDPEMWAQVLRENDFDPIGTHLHTEADFLAALQCDPPPELLLFEDHPPTLPAGRVLQILAEQHLEIPSLLIVSLEADRAWLNHFQPPPTNIIFTDRLWRLGSAVRQALNEQRLRREHQQLEATLRASEARFRSLIENSLDSVSLLDAAGRIIYTSPANQRLLGYAATEFVGRSAFQFVHPAEAAQARAILEQALQAPGQLIPAHVRLRHKDGNWRWVDGTVMNLLSDPTVQAIVVNYQDVTEHHVTNLALQENKTRLQLLNGILIGTASGQSVDLIIERTLRRMARAFPALRVVYSTLDGAGMFTVVNSLEPSPHPNLKGQALSLLNVPEYLSALRQRELVAIEDVTRDKKYAPLVAAFANGHTRAALNVPLQHSEQLVGVLSLNAFEPHEWSDHEATTLTEIADYLSITLQEARTQAERRQAEAQLQRRAQELTALSHMGQVVVASLDVDEVLRQVIGEVSYLLGAEGLAVELLSEDRAELVFAAVGGANATDLANLRVPSHSGVAGEVVRTGQAKLVQDSQQAAAPEVVQHISGYNPKSIVGAPLRLHGETIGAMVAIHFQANAFTPNDLQLLEAAADWACIAIGNARLFSETAEALAREKRLYAVVRAVSSALDLTTTLHNVVRLACELVGAQAGALALIEPSGETLKFSYLYHLPETLADQRVPRGQGVGWTIIEDNQAVLLSNYAQHPKARADWVAAGVHAFLGVPVVVGEDRLGVLGLFHLNPDSQFSARDLELAEAVGRQAGIAIQNARLFETERRRVAALTALNKTSLDLSAELDLNTLLRTVVERAARLLNAALGGLYLLLPDKQTLEMVVSLSGKHAGTRLQVGEGLAGQVAQSGEPLMVGDYSAWAGHLSRYDLPLHSLLGAPIKWQAEGILGVLVIGDERPHQFDAEALEIARLFADQAAVAIVNMRQHASLRRRLQESEAMAAISRALNETLDVERTLLMIVDAARRIIPQVEQAVIHLLEEDQQALRPAAVSGAETRGSKRGRRDITMRPGSGVAGQVMAEGIVINVSDTLTDPRYLPLGQGTQMRSLLVAPVQSGQRRLGTISVQSTTPHAFSADDEWLLATLGVQAALAIENARLFEIERRRAEEAEALQHVTESLISRVNLREMLSAVIEAITTIANYKYVSIFLLEDGQLVAQAYKGYSQPLPILSLTQGISGRVARTGQPVFAPDVRRDPDYVEAVSTIRSLIGVPLIHTSQTLGVLVVESDAERGLDVSDLNWLTNVGRQLSVAIQNTHLVADLEKALLQEKAARAQLVQTEKLAAMGRLVASVAHELNNPLQAIQNALYLVKQESGLSGQAREDLQVALTEADRMAELISRLRDTYRPATREDFQPESLNLLIEDVRRLITTHLRHNQVACEVMTDPRLPPMRGLRDQLKQALLNLCLNAVEAMPGGGRLTIRTSVQPSAQSLLLTIADTGGGISPEALPNIFDPFFTTKESGTGLGLAITHDIIRRHGGHIEVQSELGQGTTFRVWFPVEQNA